MSGLGWMTGVQFLLSLGIFLFTIVFKPVPGYALLSNGYCRVKQLELEVYGSPPFSIGACLPLHPGFEYSLSWHGVQVYGQLSVK
jgi:hypothetical protein